MTGVFFNIITGVRLKQCFFNLHILDVSCSDTPDSNEWLAIRLKQSFITSWSFKSGVLERETFTCRAASPEKQDGKILS